MTAFGERTDGLKTYDYWRNKRAYDAICLIMCHLNRGSHSLQWAAMIGESVPLQHT